MLYYIVLVSIIIIIINFYSFNFLYFLYGSFYYIFICLLNYQLAIFRVHNNLYKKIPF